MTNSDAPTTWEDLGRKAHYSAQRLASLCAVSVRTIQRHFDTNYGIAPQAWLRALRLRDAYTRLAAGEPIKVVAYSLGFKQLSHFSRAFKQEFGMPPRNFGGSPGSNLIRFGFESPVTGTCMQRSKTEQDLPITTVTE